MRTPRDRTGNEIAIVGMAGRFPDARTLTEFWRNLEHGVESIRVRSDTQLLADGVTPEQLADSAYVRAAAVLDDMEWWDAPFWGFTPLDASIMDPQHRLFLECAWEAFEDAGHSPDAFPGAIGVYAGCGMQAYLHTNLLPNRKLMDGTGLFLVRHTGNDKDFLSTRVSYHMNLRGPSVTVQTACSTSLVAIHVASQSLLSGECDMALAGGVTIEVPHRLGYRYEPNEILSPDGHCRAFDAAAQGTVFGSGAGAVLLRRLEDALRDGDRIHAVIRGSAINNDGAEKVGYLAPGVDGQAGAIVEAQAMAGVTADSISYIETHGTGTQIGDPLEVAALTQAFRASTALTGYCGIGSLKPNIGHLDTAAGVAGLIKTVLAMQNRKLPPSLHYTTPNPAIDFSASPFYVNATLKDWRSAGPRRAGVSSLGVGGTNAHIILEEAAERLDIGPSRPWQLVVLSARTKSALDSTTANLADHFDLHRGDSLASAAYTLSIGRKALAERRVVVASSVEDARRALDTEDRDRVRSDTASDHARPAFLFAGGGAQFAGMGAALYEHEHVYRAAVETCLAQLDLNHARSVRALLRSPAADDTDADFRLALPSFALPALFSTQYAMAMLFESWGIVPAAMIGHSMGEYTAAHLAGVFSLRDAMRLVTLRGRLFELLPDGAMLSVPLSEDALQPLLGEELSLAAVNAPELCVASGSLAAIAALEQTLTERGLESKRLHIAVAAHSAMLEPILEEFGAFLRTVELHPPARPFASNETGTWITAAQATDPAYWVRHLRNTVRFADGLKQLLADPAHVLVEVGPGRVLATLARQHPDRQQGQLVVTSMLAAGDEGSDQATALLALGQLWARGVRPDWNAYWAGEHRMRVGLPTYPWERQRHWIDAPAAIANTAAPNGARRPRVEDWFSRPSWRQTLPPPLLAASSERVLVFADAVGIADAIAEQLQASGRRVICVIPGAEFSRNGDQFSLHPASTGDHTQMLAALAAGGGLPDRVVFAWGITDPAARSALAAVTENGFHALLAFARALANEDPDATLTLDVITNDLQQIGGENQLDPLKALLLGPLRVMPREFPNIRTRAIDIVLPGIPRRKALAKLLAAEIASSPVDPTIAFRGPDRYVQELTPVNIAVAAGTPFVSRLRDGGVYLITGGLGGIGFAVAQHLAATRKARLVLLSRSATPQSAREQVAALEALGAEVEIVQADVTDRAQLRAALARGRARFGPLNGVFHAAGVLADSLMPFKTRLDAERVLAPKVEGTLALDVVLGDEPLDLFVLFSSVSSIAGVAGQADYAAANAFLDAFAHERSTHRGQFTIAIGWSAWNDLGMTAGTAASRASTGIGESVHPLLGTRIAADAGAELFAADLAVGSHWTLAEHRLRGGSSLLPGAAFLEIARAAASARPEARPLEMRDVTFFSPFVVADDAPRELRVHLGIKQPTTEGRAITIAGRSTDEAGASCWQEHVTAIVGYVDAAPPATLDLASIRARCNECERHHSMDGAGDPHLIFGPRWQNVLRVHRGDGEALLDLALAEPFRAELEAYPLHPALLDMATAGAQNIVPGVDPTVDFYVPLSYTCLRMFSPLTAEIHSHVRLVPNSLDPKELLVFDVTITDSTGRVLVEVEEFMMTRVAGAAQLEAAGARAHHRTSLADFDPAVTVSAPAAEADNAIRVAEGMHALDCIVAGPAISHVIVTPTDVRVLFADLQRTKPVEAFRGLAASSEPLDQIEAVLASHDSVTQGVVLQRVNRPGERKLVAYIVFAPGESATVSDLRRFLRSRLPDHLVPSTFMDLDALPMQRDGTVDRGALPDPFGATDDFVAPRTETEILVAEIWKEVLGVGRVSVHDNFFDAGGHSLLSVRALTRLDKRIGVRLDQATMVLQTLEQIAAECDRRRSGAVAPPATARVAPAAIAPAGFGRRLVTAWRGK